ncbi:MAG: hypothetical protein ACOYMB_03370 [Patescibacteria group bacterium]
MKKVIKTIIVNDKMQKNYRYQLTESTNSNFSPDFKPELTPIEMLSLGVFGGRYLRDCRSEFPTFWFKNAKFSSDKADKKLNYFRVKASTSLNYWREKGWINENDPRGWFQWYCRYYLGRRLGKEDERQIRRWKAMRRHVIAIKNNCRAGDLNCRPRQRQAVMHWAYDSRNF